MSPVFNPSDPTPPDVRLGATSVNRLYRGSVLVYDRHAQPLNPADTTVPIALQTNHWGGVDLSEVGIVTSWQPNDSFTLVAGTLPSGVVLDSVAGLVCGAAVTPGSGDATVQTNSGQQISLPWTVVRGFDSVRGGAIRRLTPLGLTGLANPERATFAIRFMIPAGHTDDVVLLRGFDAFRLRVLGANGRIRFDVNDPSGTSLFTLTSTPAGVDYRDGNEHTVIISSDLNADSPTVALWVDGIERSWNNPAAAGHIRTETNSYSIAADTSGVGLPLPATGSIRWAYIEFGAARTATEVTAYVEDVPGALGAPQIFFGGTLSDWQNGVNFGTTADWSVQHGTWTVVDERDPVPQAFPGALGYGKYATGGIGRTMYRVTNTSANPATSGSLPWALAQAQSAGGGYIVIEAEGPLESDTFIRVLGNNITIDARRQSGLGFWLNGTALWIESSNVVVRHLRSFAGSNFAGSNPTTRDCFIVASRTDGVQQDRIYFDRCDAMFSLDEAFSVFPYRPGSTAQNVTLHGVCIAEPCHENIHLDEGPPQQFDDHSKALLTSAALSRLTFYGGLLASADDRMPRLTGQAQEIISSVIANFGSTSIQVTASATADFIRCFFMLGDRPGQPTTHTAKWVQGTTSTTLQVVYEAECFSGAWTAAGGFNDDALIDNWRNNTSGTTFMEPEATQNAQLFEKSGAAQGALTYDEAFFSLSDRVGSLNATGEHHPFVARVIGYVTEAVPFTTGWHGGPFGRRMPPDELRAVGVNITSPGAGVLRVTLPPAHEALPPVANRPWTAVSVTIVDAYTTEISNGMAATELPLTGKTWESDGITLAGSLAGGTTDFTGLLAGHYVVRVIYTAGAIPVPLYSGRPITVVV